jgi:hypothetical protein
MDVRPVCMQSNLCLILIRAELLEPGNEDILRDIGQWKVWILGIRAEKHTIDMHGVNHPVEKNSQEAQGVGASAAATTDGPANQGHVSTT